MALYVTTILAFVLLTIVCAGIVLVPLIVTPDIPDGCVAVQFKEAPATLLNVTKAEVSPEQMVWFGIEKVTIGDGFTVMVKFCDVPVHPLAFGVTLIVAVIGFTLVFFGINDVIFPVPFAAKPIAVLELVHV